MTAAPSGRAASLSDVSRQNARYRRMITIFDRVGDAALRGADPAELTAVFARMAGKTVVLLDASFRLLAEAGCDGEEAAAPWNPFDDNTTRLLTVLERERRAVRFPAVPGSSLEGGCVATPVTVGDVTLGYLVVTGSDGEPVSDDVDLLITTHAGTLFALTLAHQRTSVDLGERYRAAILDALVSGNFLDDQDAQRKAAALGLASGATYRVAVLASRSTHEHQPRLVVSPDVAHELSRMLVARMSAAAAVVRGSELVMIVSQSTAGEGLDDARKQAATAVDIATALLAQRSMPVQLTCGLSEPVASAQAAPLGLQQASDAIDLGVRIGRAGGVVAYEELGVYRLLLQIGDMRQLWQFAEDVLGPLIAYEAAHSLDLIGTLSVYLQEHASLKRAAWRLRVHTNTIAYRINRIEDLARLDLTDAEDRLSAHVAVKIIESQRAGRQPAPGGETSPGIATACR